MDIGALSIVMSQSKVQEAASLAVMKMAMNTGKESAAQMAEMLKNAVVDPNLGQHLDAKA
ncbi:YjfB family protein [Clostridium swellfunianum]|uniref:YjfB family protein n=1 Tax=Clostridium swellfunianum TaxID=1367462 RepID=UPI00202F3A30|nr:YjfB family protein [Clostridium swellfunianum]MCM0650456.1 YjfB family protein [Clostridium swellfunianum]